MGDFMYGDGGIPVTVNGRHLKIIGPGISHRRLVIHAFHKVLEETVDVLYAVGEMKGVRISPDKPLRNVIAGTKFTVTVAELQRTPRTRKRK